MKPLPTFLRKVKLVFNYAKRKPEEVVRILQLEATEFMRRNPGYMLHEFIGPLMQPDGAALYVIKLKICTSLIQHP